MPRRSATAKPSTPKGKTVRQIAEHIIETYKPNKTPTVLMWRETMNGFYLKNWPEHPIWTRDTPVVHADWKRHGPEVARILRKQYKITVVKVNHNIRDLVKHGMPPDRGGKRTDEAYRRCLPGPGRFNMTLGLALFPRDTQQDHPLIAMSKQRRCKQAGTGIHNSIEDVRTANDLGTLSDDTAREIIEQTASALKLTFDNEHYPLFNKRPEASKVSSP